MARTKKTNYSDLSVEELEDLSRQLDAEKAEIIRRKREVADALSEKVLEAQALARLEAMSDPEKRALFQHLKAKGIESAETFGKPGN